jgi:hypothetical protein
MGKKPTIEELEAILNSGEEVPIEILPNGEVRARLTRTEELLDERDALRKRVAEAEELAKALRMGHRLKDAEHALYEDEWKAKCKDARRDALIEAADLFEHGMWAPTHTTVVKQLREMAEREPPCG